MWDEGRAVILGKTTYDLVHFFGKSSLLYYKAIKNLTGASHVQH